MATDDRKHPEDEREDEARPLDRSEEELPLDAQDSAEVLDFEEEDEDFFVLESEEDEIEEPMVVAASDEALDAFEEPDVLSSDDELLLEDDDFEDLEDEIPETDEYGLAVEEPEDKKPDFETEDAPALDSPAVTDSEESDEVFAFEDGEIDTDSVPGLQETASLDAADDTLRGAEEESAELPDFDMSAFEEEEAPETEEEAAAEAHPFGDKGSMPEVEDLLFEEDLLAQDAEEGDNATTEEEIFESGESVAFDENGEGWDGNEEFHPDLLGIDAREEDHDLPEGGTSKFGVPSAEERDRWGDNSVFGEDEEETEDWSREEEDDFTLVDDESGLSTSGVFKSATAPAATADEVADEEGDAPLGDFETDEESEEDFDPIYGAEAAAADLRSAGFDGEEEEPDYRDHEKILVEVEQQGPSSDGGLIVPRRSRFLKRAMAATMAASVLILGLVAFLSLRPDLPLAQRIRRTIGLNTKSETEMTVAKVSRPKVDTSIGIEIPITGPGLPPKIAKAGGKEPVGPEPKTGRKPRKIEKINPAKLMQSPYLKLLRGAAAIAKGIERRTRDLPRVGGAGPLTAVEGPAITAVEPKTGEPKTGEPGALVKGAGGRALPPAVPGQVGSPAVQVPLTSEPDENVVRADGYTARRGMSSFSLGIIRGTQALAQLRNGNFFIGRVQKITKRELTLEVGKGELTFAPRQLQKLIPIAESVARQIQNSPDGYVRLKNHEKILGKIIEEGLESVTLHRGKMKIVLPRASILEVQKTKDPKLKLGKEETNWLDEELPLPEAEQGPPIPVAEAEERQSGSIRIQFKKRSGTPASPPKGK